MPEPEVAPRSRDRRGLPGSPAGGWSQSQIGGGARSTAAPAFDLAKRMGAKSHGNRAFIARKRPDPSEG